MKQAAATLSMIVLASACNDPHGTVPARQSADASTEGKRAGPELDANPGSQDGRSASEPDAKQPCPRTEADAGLPAGACALTGQECSAEFQLPCLPPNVGAYPRRFYRCVCAGEWKCMEIGSTLNRCGLADGGSPNPVPP